MRKQHGCLRITLLLNLPGRPCGHRQWPQAARQPFSVLTAASVGLFQQQGKSLDWEHTAASLGSAPYPGAAQREWCIPVIFGSVPPGHPYAGNSELAVKLPWNWVVLDRNLSLIVQICIENYSLRLWGTSFVSSAVQFLTKLPWHCASKQQPSD